jgi:hypothetical protein
VSARPPKKSELDGLAFALVVLVLVVVVIAQLSGHL